MNEMFLLWEVRFPRLIDGWFHKALILKSLKLEVSGRKQLLSQEGAVFEMLGARREHASGAMHDN